jgi:hypothetical protein
MKTLNGMALANVQGGDVVEWIDGACVSIGIGGVFWAKALAYPVAFCAGWALGRYLTS